MSLPMIITFEVGANDDGLREYIHGAGPLVHTCKQSVVVQNHEEMQRTIAKVFNLKLKRGLPCGGAIAERYDGRR